jgi:hypothetical protein
VTAVRVGSHISHDPASAVIWGEKLQDVMPFRDLDKSCTQLPELDDNATEVHPLRILLHRQSPVEREGFERRSDPHDIEARALFP